MCSSSRVRTTGDPGVASGASCGCVRIHSNDLNHPAQLNPTLNCQLTVKMQWETMGSSTQLPTVRGQTSLVVVLKNCHNFDNRYDVSDFIYLLSFGLHSLIKKKCSGFTFNWDSPLNVWRIFSIASMLGHCLLERIQNLDRHETPMRNLITKCLLHKNSRWEVN